MRQSISTRATTFASPLGTFAGWQLSVACPSCDVMRIVPINDVIRTSSSIVRLGAVVTRLRCQKCRMPPNWVAMTSQIEGKPVQVVQLVGTGPPDPSFTMR
jgi:hypothetical protein